MGGRVRRHMWRLAITLAAFGLSFGLLPTADAAIVEEASFGATPSELSAPTGIAVGKDGSIYVVDQARMQVQKFDSTGKFLMSIGEPGTDASHDGAGQLWYPHAIATDSTGDYLYVADTMNNRIQVFTTADGGYLRKWGTYGSGNGEMNNPTGIVLDSDDNVYVADSRNQRVDKFNSTGTFIKSWGSAGTGLGQFAVPSGIAFDPSFQEILVTDEYIGRFQAFTLDGSFIAEFGRDDTGSYILDHPDGITTGFGTEPVAYVAEAGSSELSKFTGASEQWTFSTAFGKNTFVTPHGISYSVNASQSRTGELFVADGQGSGKMIHRLAVAGDDARAKLFVNQQKSQQSAVAHKRLLARVTTNLFVGSCWVKADGTLGTPLDEIDGDNFKVAGPKMAVGPGAGLEYSIPLTAREVKAIKETKVIVTLRYTSPGGCNGGDDEPSPVKVSFRI